MSMLMRSQEECTFTVLQIQFFLLDNGARNNLNRHDRYRIDYEQGANKWKFQGNLHCFICNFDYKEKFSAKN